MALPNKFFEFIQARLAIAIVPSPEMARLTREFDCGVVAEDFSSLSLARALTGLTAQGIDWMKRGADRAARMHNAERIHHAESNASRFREIVGAALHTVQESPR